MTITRGVYSCVILVFSFGFAKTQQCAVGEYRSNPNNCNGFLQCVHGSLVEMPCPAGLHWNDRIKVCDWPQNARCRVTTTSPSPTTITTDIPIITEKHPTETVTEEQGCALGEYRPNPNNCNGFLQCVHGSFVTMPCPAGLQWNDRVQTCDWPQNAKCRVTTISPPSTTTEIPTTATEEQLIETTTVEKPVQTTTEERPIETATEEQPFETTSSPSNITPVCKCGEHLPSQSECADFYRCEDDVLVLHTCPLGLHWNTELEVCDWPYSANCTLHTSKEPISTITTDTPEPITDTPAPTTVTPAPTTDTPAPTTDTPAPTTDTPAPTTDTPAPTTDTPAPTTDTPAPTTDTPAPITDTPAPITDTPAPTTTTAESSIITSTPKPTTTTVIPTQTTTTTPEPTTTTITPAPTTTITTPELITTTTTTVPTTTTITPAPTEEDDYDEDDSEEITLPSWFPDS